MVSKATLWILLIVTGIQTTVCAQLSDFKSIGYLPHYRFDLVKELEIEGLSHINIAFANPDASGNLSVKSKEIKSLVDHFHKEDKQVFISLAGGGLKSELSNRWRTLMSPKYRSWFISKIVAYVDENNFDGVDLDLEWGDVNRYYSDFVVELKQALRLKNIPLTAALPALKKFKNIDHRALDSFDWINLMVYDHTGPWAPKIKGQHSSYAMAVAAIDFWQDQGVESERLVLGIPFYGYDFSSGTKVTSVTLRDISQANPKWMYVDNIGEVWYNGIPTILEKYKLAKEEVNGIMIWELGQDAFSSHSVVKKLASLKKEIEEEETLYECRLSHNPTHSFVELYFTNSGRWEIELLSLTGEKLLEDESIGQKEYLLDLRLIPDGFYYLKLTNNEIFSTLKLSKVDY